MKTFCVLFACLALASTQGGEFFTTWPHGTAENYTQEIHGVDDGGSLFVGIAIVGDGVMGINCGTTTGVLFPLHGEKTVTKLGTKLYASTKVTLPRAGCNIINHPDGYLYLAAQSLGIVRLDPNNGFKEVPIAGQLGGQRSATFAQLGMAVDPQNLDQIYFVSGNWIYVLTLSTNSVRKLPDSYGGCHDGAYFNAAGTLLAVADTCTSSVRFFGRNGGQISQVICPGGPDGVAFHSCTESAFVANNDGTMWRINLTDFTSTRFAVGGTRGDIGVVAPDGCFYVNFNGRTRFRDGISPVIQNSIIKICNGACPFYVPPGVTPGSICGNGVIEEGEQCEGGICCDTTTCTYLPSNVTCRIAAGPCDLPETCSGSSGSCPDNTLAPKGTPCGEFFGMCDVQIRKTCSGSDANCYGPPKVPAVSYLPIEWTDFNVISFDTFTCDAGDVEGRLAVKNKATLGDFTLGLQLRLETDGWETATLLVGGDTKWDTGSMHPDGSDTTVHKSGPITKALVGGDFDAPTYLADREDEETIVTDAIPSFNQGRDYYVSVQNELASLPINAIASIKYGDGLFIACQEVSDVYHVKITSAQLGSANWISLSGCRFSASWILDITGTENVKIQGQAFPGIVERVIYNVLGSGRVITGDTGVAGHILAPSNTFSATSGVTYGILVAGDIKSLRQSNKPNCLNFRPVSIATKVVKPVVLGDKTIFVADLAPFIAGDLVCVNSDCRKILSGEIRDFDGDGKLDHSITVEVAFAQNHPVDSFLTTEVADVNQNRSTPLAVAPTDQSAKPFGDMSAASSMIIAFFTLAVLAIAL